MSDIVVLTGSKQIKSHIEDWFGAWDQQLRDRKSYVLFGDDSGFPDYPPIDLTVERMHYITGMAQASYKSKRKKGPRLHPTKGYRGAHKAFRGGSR